jgi:hypothetical protein
VAVQHPVPGAAAGASVMMMKSYGERRLDELQAELGRAQAGSAWLMSKVADACGRTVPGVSARGRIDRLIAVEAWTEAALALAELESPRWKLRRLIWDDGNWICLLSSQWKLPDWLDDQVEFRHESLPLAILGALVAARRCGETAAAMATARSVPRCPIELKDGTIISCDNFA